MPMTFPTSKRSSFGNFMRYSRQTKDYTHPDNDPSEMQIRQKDSAINLGVLPKLDFASFPNASGLISKAQ